MSTGIARERTPTSRPELSDQQKSLVVSAAAELIRAAVLRRQPNFPDPTLAGASNVTLSGSFVSLKRAGHLRSCCGMLGDPIPLGAALQDAAQRTALEDIRFPPISPTELPHLDLEVWLLYQPERLTASGEERVKAVTIGRHGLQVVRGESRGLLLPGVAIEMQLDSAAFLQQVCLKAGIHASSWKDDATALYTFEGDAIRGRIDLAGSDVDATASAALFSSQEWNAYVEFCRDNIAAMLRGATPSYYFMGAPDCNVAGLILSVTRPGTEPVQFSHYSLRPGIPLQATLFSLSQNAARVLAGRPDGAQIDLTVLHDPAMHGTVADVDRGGLDVKQRAVMVLERNKCGLVFDPARAAGDVVDQAAREANVGNPAAAAVYSLGAVSSAPRVVLSTAPRAVRGPATRQPGVAGTFYPADPGELNRLVDSLIGDPAPPEDWPAAMVPHAGLIYSGRIAAEVLKRLRIPDTVIVIGPKHTVLGVDWAVAPQQEWEIPGHTIRSDAVLARRLVSAIPGLELDSLAHQREHAIEVELPLLARLAPGARVVGIAIGAGDYEACQRFAAGLVSVIRELERPPLLLISSDMNHFATDAENRRLDEIALRLMERLDPEALLDTCRAQRISMCGVLPAVIVMSALRMLGRLAVAQRAGYATTADVTGDRTRVVGYAGMLIG